eukprot:scaffold5888_cov62-Phaeocystis_antarctica.AAC.6
MKHVRFAAMAEGFLRETVGAWPALRSAEGRDVLFNAVLPLVGGTKVVSRLGFGPRLIYVDLWAAKATAEGSARWSCTTRRPPRGRNRQAWRAHASRTAASLWRASSTPCAAMEPALRSSTRRRCTIRRLMAGSPWPR